MADEHTCKDDCAVCNGQVPEPIHNMQKAARETSLKAIPWEACTANEMKKIAIAIVEKHTSKTFEGNAILADLQAVEIKRKKARKK